MNSNLGLELIVYGVLTAILSVILQSMVSNLAQVILIAGLAGGALCVIWGLRAVTGRRGRVWAILTLAILAFIFLSQSVIAWMGHSEAQSIPLLAKILLTLMLVVSVGLLLIIAYADQNIKGPAQKRF